MLQVLSHATAKAYRHLRLITLPDSFCIEDNVNQLYNFCLNVKIFFSYSCLRFTPLLKLSATTS